MNKDILLQELKDSVGTKDPIVYFEKMVDVFQLLFSNLDELKSANKLLQNDLEKVKRNTALSICWEPKVAADLLLKEIDILRKDKDTYFLEIASLQKAYSENRITQNYTEFVQFWVEVLGWHPFLEYKD